MVPVKTLQAVTNAAVLVLLAYLLFHPSGPIITHYDQWRWSQEEARLVQSNWDRLTEGIATLGGGSDVVAVEFIDYECRFCQQMEEMRRSIDVAGRSPRAFRHLPLDRIHPNARLAAEISICGEVFPDAWPRLHEALYDTADNLGSTTWIEDLQGARLSAAEWKVIKECIDSGLADDRLEQDREFAEMLRIRGTPTYVFPDGVVRGAMTREEYIRNFGPNPPA